MLRPTAPELASLLLLTVACLPAHLHAQEPKIPDTPEVLHLAPPPSDRFPAKWYPRVGDGTDVVPAPVLDRPFTARMETGGKESASGQTVRHVRDDLRARDRLGRTRNDDDETGGITIGGQMVRTKSVTVSDPVTHCGFTWTEPPPNIELPRDLRVALVTCGPQTLRYREFDVYAIVLNMMVDGTTHEGETTTKVEHPPPLLIDGITVNRIRVSNTRPDEHGKEKTQSTETWYSPELKELVRSRSNEEDEYFGLTDIQRKDPDPKLFYPPDGYRIEVQPPR